MTLRAPQAGELDTLISIVRLSDSPADVGELTTTETEILKRWAKIVPVGTATYVETCQTDTGITHRIYIDYTPDIFQFDVCKTSDGRRFRVQRSCALNGGRVCTILECEELSPQVY